MSIGILLNANATSVREHICVVVVFYFFKELSMNKWIMPLVCVAVLAACSSTGGRGMGSTSGSSSGMGSGSGSASGSASPSSGSSGMNGSSGTSGSPATSGTYQAPGTDKVPGSKGT